MKIKNKFIYCFLLVSLFLGGCAPIVRPEQPTQSDVFVLKPGSTIGQTFVANFAGLNGVELALSQTKEQDNQTATGILTLHLRTSPTAEEDIATASFPLSQVPKSGFYRFIFTPQKDSLQKYYYFSLEVQGGFPIEVGRAPREVYLDGSSYRNENPYDESQLTFLLDYEPKSLVTGLLIQGIQWLWYLIIGFFLFILPGFAILLWSKVKIFDTENVQISESSDKQNESKSTNILINTIIVIGLSAGISVALYPLLFLLSDLVGLHLGKAYAWTPGIAAIIYLLFLTYKKEFDLSFSSFKIKLSPSFIFHPEVVAFFVIVLIVFSRFWVIRNLEGAMWGDGYQHTVVLQLFLNNHGLFNSWLPFSNVDTFTYHFGFHSAAAVFAWLTGLKARFATLWTGQLLNILAIIAIYPMAIRISKNRWGGVFAITIAGLLTPMPMFYTNWGRYTQLAGQVILPIALVVTWGLLDKNRKLNWREIIITGIIWAGLGLSHYRVLIFGVLGILAYLITHLSWKTWKPLLVNLAKISFTSGILFLPWFIRVFSGNIMHLFSAQLIKLPSQNPTLAQSYINIGQINTYLPYWVWLLMFIGIGTALWQRKRWAATLAVWVLLLFIAANPAWINLPGTNSLSNFAIFIAAYIPAAWFGGILLADIALTIKPKWIVNPIITLLILVLAIYNAPNRIREIQPTQYAMLTRPDVLAGEWIQINTPPDSVFWINSFTAFVNARVGADGGWWLPLSANRLASVRPLNTDFEQPLPQTQKEMDSRLAELLQIQGQVDTPEVFELMNQRNITHIYIGQQHGTVNYNGTTLNPALFVQSNKYHLIYHQDAVWVFEVKP